MKRLIILTVFTAIAGAMQAQEDVEMLQDTPTATVVNNTYLPYVPSDSLHLMPLSIQGTPHPLSYYPSYWGNMTNWDLHKGLNMTLGASVFAEFGKHARYGAGFSQNISMMYAQPLTPKLSLAIGGYFNNITWQHTTTRDAGLTAILGYQFDEHWEAYLYAQKSFMPKHDRIVHPIYYDMGIGDKIGATVKYNFNPNFSIQVSVERGSYPDWDQPFLPAYVP